MKCAAHTGWTIALFLLLCAPLATQAQTSSAAERNLRIHGIEMHVQELGEGAPLLLLHGFGGCGRDWQTLLGPLSAHYRLIVPDLRGHGRSTNPSGAFTHRQAATDVLAMLDRLGVTRFKAIGISSGGMTLLHMATRAPSRVEAMVLVGAAPYFPEQARKITRAAAEHGSRPADIAYFERCAARGHDQVDEIAKQFAGFSRSYEDMNFTPPLLGTIQARTLIVHGDRDEFFPVNIPVDMHDAIPGSALWIVPQGSHVPIFGDHAREFEQVVLRFLQPPQTPR